MIGSPDALRNWVYQCEYHGKTYLKKVSILILFCFAFHAVCAVLLMMCEKLCFWDVSDVMGFTWSYEWQGDGGWQVVQERLPAVSRGFGPLKRNPQRYYCHIPSCTNDPCALWLEAIACVLVTFPWRRTEGPEQVPWTLHSLFDYKWNMDKTWINIQGVFSIKPKQKTWLSITYNFNLWLLCIHLLLWYAMKISM